MKKITFLFCLLISTFGYAQISLPFDFETTPVTADFIDFDGGTTTVIANPQSGGINTSGSVAQIVRNGGQPWGGSKIVLLNSLDFTTNNSFSMKVFSPAVGVPVLFKLEVAGGGAAERTTNTTVANEWETLTWDFTGEPSNVYNEVVFIFNIGTVGDGTANSTYLFDDVEFIDGSGGLAQVDLPITFEDAATVDYDLTDFGGNTSSIVVDPTDPTNMVGQAVKAGDAQLWAGTTMGNNGLATIIPLSLIDSKMTARVWSPDAGTPIRLKVENSNDVTQTCETETNTTVAGGWETLEFDFATEAPGTAQLSFGLANGWIYNKVSIFFNFGTDGATAGEKTYYWDDVTFGGGGGGLTQVDLPVTFEDANTDYNLTDFGGNGSSIVVDPTDPTNMVGQAIKAGDAQLWAGTTMGDSGLATAIPFVTGSTTMTVRVWSPDAGTPIRLKVEDAGDPTISVETEVMTTAAATWETLEFDFSNEVGGTSALNIANTYDKISIFFNFGTDGATAGEKTYYWDDVMFSGGGGGLTQVDLPVTFEDANTDYNLTDFGGNGSSIVVDPTDPTNMVGQAVKAGDAQLWAGTTMGGSGLATAIPFVTGSTTMTARVWSPDAGTPIRLKVENTLDGTISVETEATTTVAGGWEMLTFDFSNEAAGTAAINLASVYNKISIFFNFGTDGATAGEKTYYWDDVMFGGGGGGLTQVDLPITFEDANTDYNLTDFGGNGSLIIVDPTDPGNLVGQAIKAGDAQLWAGTTMGDSGLANAIPFAMGDTKMTVRVWSPDSGTPIRLKAEDATDPTISVETEATTTVTGAWETLEFDFSNEATGTAAINFANTYDKISIFFNFGTDGATAGEKIYYWDDVMFGPITSIKILNAADSGIKISPNPSSSFFNIEFPEALTEPVHMMLFDVNGKLLKEGNMVDQISQINVSELNSGMYFLRMDRGGVSYFQKVMVSK